MDRDSADRAGSAGGEDDGETRGRRGTDIEVGIAEYFIRKRTERNRLGGFGNGKRLRYIGRRVVIGISGLRGCYRARSRAGAVNLQAPYRAVSCRAVSHRQC